MGVFPESIHKGLAPPHMSEPRKSWQFIATPGQSTADSQTTPTWEQELDASHSKNWNWKPYTTGREEAKSLFVWDDPPSRTDASRSHFSDDIYSPTDALSDDNSRFSTSMQNVDNVDTLLSSLAPADVRHLYTTLLRPDEDTEHFLESLGLPDGCGDMEVPPLMSDSQMQVEMMKERSSEGTQFCDVHSSDNPPVARDPSSQFP